jgi:hypothetical protein
VKRVACSLQLMAYSLRLVLMTGPHEEASQCYHQGYPKESKAIFHSIKVVSIQYNLIPLIFISGIGKKNTFFFFTVFIICGPD